MKEAKRYIVSFLGFGVVAIFQGIQYWNVVFIFMSTLTLTFVLSKIAKNLDNAEYGDDSQSFSNDEETPKNKELIPLIAVACLGALAGCFIRFEILGWP